MPVARLLTGPYSSCLPKYDSSKANISKIDSDLLYLTYGDNAGLFYAKHFESFAKNTEYDVRKHVDEILNTITKGGHDVVKNIEELDKRRQNKQRSLRRLRKRPRTISRCFGDLKQRRK